MLSVSLDGDEALVSRFRDLPRAVQAALRAKAEALAEALRLHVVQDKLSGQILQTRSGALRNAIAAEASSDGGRLLIRLFARGDVRYAAIQEYGGRTPAHDIVPDKAKALAFVIGGRTAFARIVHHPGSTIPARPFMAPALAEMKPQILSELKAAALAAVRT